MLPLLRKKILLSFLAVGLFVTGCAFREKVLPAHDEVLIYPLAFDLTYLRALEAVENIPNWELTETEKEKGIIRVRNTNFSRFGDADKREATIIVKRVGRRETSIEFAPESKRVVGGDKLLERIAQFVTREL